MRGVSETNFSVNGNDGIDTCLIVRWKWLPKEV